VCVASGGQKWGEFVVWGVEDVVRLVAHVEGGHN